MDGIVLIARGFIIEEVLPLTLNDESLFDESECLNSDEIYQLFSSSDYDYE